MVIVQRPHETGEGERARAPGTFAFADAYRRICRVARQRSLGGSSTASPQAPGGAAVLIVATPEVDSLAATRILTQLLANDEIPYRVAPANGYRCLQQILLEDVHDHLELHTLVFINLGSLMSLPTSVPLPPYCTLHVLDMHRPWNLDNLFATSQINDQVWVWDDGEILERMHKEREAYEALEFDVDSDSDEDEDEDEEDGADDEGAEGDESGAEQTRTRPRPPRMDRERRQLYRAVLARYYGRGTWSGMSTAMMMYMLSVSLGRSDNDALWYAILGTTSQYLANSIHYGTYDGYASALASDVVAMNARDEPGSDTRGGLKDVNMHGADDLGIRVVPEELRFTLYRHWSLEMSMYHTGYVAAKLGIWREKGMSRLRGLLAKMGLSLSECRQTFEHMDLDLRQTLVERIEAIAPEYGLTELVYRSFTRSYGFRSMPLSAADCVEGIAALLQAAHGVRIEIDGPQLVRADSSYAGSRGASSAAAHHSANMPDTLLSSYGGRTLWNLGDTGVTVGPRGPRTDSPEEQREAGAQLEDARRATWVQNFFEAYRAMDAHKGGSVALLRSSLQLAKALHRSIVAQGVAIIAKQSIKTLKSFRVTVLHDGPSLALFCQPDTLMRLGFWLIDALRDIVGEQNNRRLVEKRARKRHKGADDDSVAASERAARNLPFVLAALDAARDVFVVVGVVGAADFGDTARNRFGLAFQDAAASSGARMRNDRFESSVVEVQREDLMTFVEALHLKSA